MKLTLAANSIKYKLEVIKIRARSGFNAQNLTQIHKFGAEFAGRNRLQAKLGF